jgi:hypothetical protein
MVIASPEVVAVALTFRVMLIAGLLTMLTIVAFAGMPVPITRWPT